MNIYHDFSHKFHRAVVVVGSFDGVHKGHQQLIDELNQEANRIGGEAVVITFDPHPREVFGRPNKLLSSIEERIILLKEAGVRNLVIINFTKEFAKTSASNFAKKLLKEALGAECVFTGVGHTFGHNREGSDSCYADYGLREISIERTLPISSTKVREAVEKGDLATTLQILSPRGYMIQTPIKTPNKLLPPLEHNYLCTIDKQEKVMSGEEIKNFSEKKLIFIKNNINFVVGQ